MFKTRKSTPLGAAIRSIQAHLSCLAQIFALHAADRVTAIESVDQSNNKPIEKTPPSWPIRPASKGYDLFCPAW